jgi:hypothetical protein
VISNIGVPVRLQQHPPHCQPEEQSDEGSFSWSFSQAPGERSFAYAQDDIHIGMIFYGLFNVFDREADPAHLILAEPYALNLIT